MITMRRWILGCKYQELAKELYEYDITPEFLWTPEQKLRVIEILEKEAEMDIELAGYLIADGDEAAMEIFNQNAAYNANRLWKLKQELAA